MKTIYDGINKTLRDSCIRQAKLQRDVTQLSKQCHEFEMMGLDVPPQLYDLLTKAHEVYDSFTEQANSLLQDHKNKI